MRWSANYKHRHMARFFIQSSLQSQKAARAALYETKCDQWLFVLESLWALLELLNISRSMPPTCFLKPKGLFSKLEHVFRLSCHYLAGTALAFCSLSTSNGSAELHDPSMDHDRTIALISEHRVGIHFEDLQHDPYSCTKHSRSLLRCESVETLVLLLTLTEVI